MNTNRNLTMNVNNQLKPSIAVSSLVNFAQNKFTYDLSAHQYVTYL